eukprot:CAMPEP_0119262256 /NCGR_PEP_ID=MMETSP1329-20130426/2047_1 /TAXON_ID=114041 /ORGANISM="Genus nov. species nov., Strain RCC1024" /LENGTH=60 /DNA_ID=CAMNT_0007261887 /DNA_START=155 /DNA_END=334 /DNA_ORIENTATION=+
MHHTEVAAAPRPNWTGYYELVVLTSVPGKQLVLKPRADSGIAKACASSSCSSSRRPPASS